ncbi:hypothetical protein EVAR_68415_1 [Eumeta japonica]|uniref:Uncharacterized protein n=1 Tax=Eumeta variegata TaxID=151549 RepID=A0A4C1ZW65_EUMVA|nr:hypothetical protein EVAR_68415_1 [Eumeta japonica]
MPRGLPTSVLCIAAAEFCERFSFCGLRTILSLYLRNALCLHENGATVVYHVFIMMCYTMPLLGAVLADNYIGRYRKKKLRFEGSTSLLRSRSTVNMALKSSHDATQSHRRFPAPSRTPSPAAPCRPSPPSQRPGCDPRNYGFHDSTGEYSSCDKFSRCLHFYWRSNAQFSKGFPGLFTKRSI